MKPYLQGADSERHHLVTPISIVLTVLTVVAAGVLIWILLAPSRKPPVNSLTVNSSMNSAEQAYLANIQVANTALSRAENFIHQEVTIVNGDVYNTGNQSVSALRLTIVFHDGMNQIILRETRAVLSAPLSPGEHCPFEISFEHVPASWNMQQPEIRIAYLQLPGQK
jgi:hypothetical protein